MVGCDGVAWQGVGWEKAHRRCGCRVFLDRGSACRWAGRQPYRHRRHGGCRGCHVTWLHGGAIRRKRLPAALLAARPPARSLEVWTPPASVPPVPLCRPQVTVDGQTYEGGAAAITIANAAPPTSLFAHAHVGDCIPDGGAAPRAAGRAARRCAPRTRKCTCVLPRAACLLARSRARACVRSARPTKRGRQRTGRGLSLLRPNLRRPCTQRTPFPHHAPPPHFVSLLPTPP